MLKNAEIVSPDPMHRIRVGNRQLRLTDSYGVGADKTVHGAGLATEYITD